VAYNADAMMEGILEAKDAIADRSGPIDVALVLGSGLGAYADGLEGARSIPYAEIPNMPTIGVSGHAGNLVIGTKAGRRVAAMQGRAHLYEGRSPHEVVFGVRLMAQLGARTLIITNAAGGIASAFVPGDLMAITDQLNLTGTSSLLGPNDERLGERFVDMSAAYDRGLIETASAVAGRLGFELQQGIYAGLLGPAYETPAEVRMLRTLGADAVGMSTVLEVLAARQLGLAVLGISCISNLAAGISDGPLSHDEVKDTAARVQPRFESLITGILESM
jgi:purine-nucleoside phosphorylase